MAKTATIQGAIGATANAGAQYAVNKKVNWKQVAKSGAISAVAGGAGAAAAKSKLGKALIKAKSNIKSAVKPKVATHEGLVFSQAEVQSASKWSVVKKNDVQKNFNAVMSKGNAAKQVKPGVGEVKGISDEAFVRFDPTKVRKSISNSGIQTQFFVDKKVWFTKYKYVKDISNPVDLETILYNKNIQQFTQGKFSSGADLYYLRNIDHAVAAGKTNMNNGIPQWRITRDIPTKDIELIKTLSPFNK